MKQESQNNKQGSWRIAQGLTKEVLCDSGNNIYSPTCITEALKVLQLGASGKTKQELDSLIGPLEKEEPVMEDYGFELPKWQELNDYEAIPSVGLWLDKQSRPTDAFLERSMTAGIKPDIADFSNPLTSEEISAWIKEGTRGLLNPQVQLTPEALACIASVLYFKDAWFRTFDKEDTVLMTFRAVSGDVKAEFMTKLSGAKAEQNDGFLAFSLPLASGAHVVFALPDEDVRLPDILAGPYLYEAFANPPKYDQLNDRTELFIPKFESESIFKGLANSLQAIGFSTAAAPEMGPITGAKEMPADIVHGAKISVDEIGVEAAAYTLIRLILGLPATNPPKPKKVVLDRPFAYAIISNTGLPLFIGTVTDPSLH